MNGSKKLHKFTSTKGGHNLVRSRTAVIKDRVEIQAKTEEVAENCPLKGTSAEEEMSFFP